MNNLKQHITITFLFAMTFCIAQISPGDLTQSHANLEGMSNCTQCHDLGDKVSNTKCLDCHKEIKSLINQNRGFHASSSVAKKDCFACHSEHHGRKFDMVRFDEKKFNHSLTGYNLEGKHKTVDCRECHKPANIQNTKIKNQKNTFLGLNNECLSCHADFHQNTFSTDCTSCHSMDAFKPVVKFDHDQADFKLKGKHTSVSCVECHKITTRNGREFQEFTNIPFEDCKTCHQDPHNNKLPGKCAQCHTETSFTTFTGSRQFNHNLTGFKLKGSHSTIDCFSCHDRTSNPLNVFQDNIGTQETNCIACHQDQHEGKYGTDCNKCHNESSFLSLNDMNFFDHTVTDYPLEGKHLEVDCKQCHKERFSAPIDFSACNNCHIDYHQGEFKENGIAPDCVTCHSLSNGFDYSLFTIEQHQKSSFPLEGAHTATPCFACHVSEEEERWTFRNIGGDCIDCHQDFHSGFIGAKYYPNNDCTSCHVNDAWDIVNFNHNKTNWPLTGKHTSVDCRQCHFEIVDNNVVSSQTFSNLDTNCTACHEDVHNQSFAIEGVTDCNRCHVTDSWFPKKFDHNSTAFPLEGRHREIDCKACHELSNKDGETAVIYKLNKLQCIDCHQ